MEKYKSKINIGAIRPVFTLFNNIVGYNFVAGNAMRK